MLPDRAQSLDLLYDAGCPPSVIEHVETVARLALALADHAPSADRAVVEAGALLHDIGRAFTHGVDHVWRGVAFLEHRHVDERVVRCVARHMGAGLTEDEARALGFPPGAYMPETIEERIVCHADNLTSHTTYHALADEVGKLEGKGLVHAVARLKALHDGLRKELGVDPDAVAGVLGRVNPA